MCPPSLLHIQVTKQQTATFNYHAITIYVLATNMPLNEIYKPHMPITLSTDMRQLFQCIYISHMNSLQSIMLP